MATIHEFLKAARQMEAFQRQASESLASINRISEQAAGISRLGESIAEVRQRMLVLGQAAEAMKPITTSLAFPASVTSGSIASMLDVSRPSLKIAELMGVASRDWKVRFGALGAANAQSLLPVQSHFAKLYELSKIVSVPRTPLLLTSPQNPLRLGGGCTGPSASAGLNATSVGEG